MRGDGIRDCVDEVGERLDYIQAVEKSDTKFLLWENILGFPCGTTNLVWSIRRN
jgi:hypothetical protein